MSFFAIITTIQEPTACMQKLAARLASGGGTFLVTGDRKGPGQYEIKNSVFLSFEDQQKSDFTLAKKLPANHYARKNLGYLSSFQMGATCIYETDDDNQPNENWRLRSKYLDDVDVVRKTETPSWVNVYKFFSDELIWPRGLPLDQIGVKSHAESGIGPLAAPIQQGLVNRSPDVDAIWRLTMDRPFLFNSKQRTVVLERGNWCPFNTQSTWWWPSAFPLLYLPSFCSFRMCDIWRSFIAQRCAWEFSKGIAFHSPEVDQLRNTHDLIQDFEGEICGYQKNHQIADLLSQLKLKSGLSEVTSNLLSCYRMLCQEGIFPDKELDLVERWVADYEATRLQNKELRSA